MSPAKSKEKDKEIKENDPEEIELDHKVSEDQPYLYEVNIQLEMNVLIDAEAVYAIQEALAPYVNGDESNNTKMTVTKSGF